MVLLLGAKRPRNATRKTIEIISEAESFIEARVNEAKLFGGAKHEALARRCAQKHCCASDAISFAEQ